MARCDCLVWSKSHKTCLESLNSTYAMLSTTCEVRDSEGLLNQLTCMGAIMTLTMEKLYCSS